MRLIVAVTCLCLAACSTQADEAPIAATEEGDEAQQANSAPTVMEEEGRIVASDAQPIPALDGAGLRMVIPSGATRLLAFGSPRDDVENAIARSLGQGGTRMSNDECGAGPMEFFQVNGLTLSFQDDRFIGWLLQEPSPLTTIDGVGIGKLRSEVEAVRSVTMTEGSTLGAEFSAGDIGGFFDGEGGTVSALYAGTQCFFR